MSLTATNPLHTNTRHRGRAISRSTIRSTPPFTANQTGGPVPLHVKFTDTSTGSPTTWSWNFGDGTTSSSQNPVHTYTNPGTYSVTLTASNGYSSHTTTALKTSSRSYGTPGAQFTANQTAGPRPLTVQFTDTSTGHTGRIGRGTLTATGDRFDRPNPVHVFSGAGTHNVVLTVSNPWAPILRGAGSTIRSMIRSPRSSASTPSLGRPPHGRLHPHLDRRRGYRGLDFGDGTTSSLQNPVHTYTTAGTYTANLTVWHSPPAGPTSTASTTIVAYALPNAMFTSSPPTGTRSRDRSVHGHIDREPDDVGLGLRRREQHHGAEPYGTFTGRGSSYRVTLTVQNLAGVDPTPASRQITVM